MRPRRRSFAFHPKGNEPIRGPVSLAWARTFAADEFRLLQINEETQAGFDRVVLRGKIGAVQRITHFQAQRVARAEPAGPDA